MKVAIIGAGFSGMLAAYLLEKEGVDVTVYEKQEYIGGHCRTLKNKTEYTELGTAVIFSKVIKELLIELKIDYSERFVYRNFLDENCYNVEHVLRDEVPLLLHELGMLKVILKRYSNSLEGIDYGYVHPDLLVPLSVFLQNHNLNTLYHVITPHLSSFGFGDIENIQAYYAFKSFDIQTIYTFIQGKKLLFIKKGTSELIQKLQEKISDIRLALNVTDIYAADNKVVVDTLYGSDTFDKVLITTKLKPDIIKDHTYKEYMEKIATHPFITCAFEVTNKKLATTYYKSNLGKKGKIQFYYTTRQNNKTTLVAYAYGTLSKSVIDDITTDLDRAGIDIKHLITVKQWDIFPHLKEEILIETYYKEIIDIQNTSNIWLVGSLVSKPELGNLYLSIARTVNKLLMTL